MRALLTSLAIFFCVTLSAQNKDVPVQINLKDGTSINAKHFGRLKCGKNTFGENHIFVRGKYLDAVTEIKDYSDIEKIVLEGYSKPPIASVGNEKAIIRVYKKNGVTVDLQEAEMFMTCYAAGDKYNEIIVQFINPITNQASEKSFATKDIYSVVFR